MAIVDANYKFLYVDVGSEGRHHDGSVFKQSLIGKALVANQLNIPIKKKPVNGPELPYIFVGDEAFALSDYMMRPYARRSLDDATGTLSKKHFLFKRI